MISVIVPVYNVESYFIKGLFSRVEHNTWPIMLLTIFAGAIGIFAVCIMIDSIREFVFNKLQIKKLLLKLENRYLPDL